MQTQEIKNLEELKSKAFELAKSLQAPHLILLEGELAVGKTQLVSYMGEALGIPKEEICSPSYSLINLYKNNKNLLLYHVDLYRLKNVLELETIAFWDIFYSPTIVFIEWPQLIKNKLPLLWNKLDISLSFSKNKNSRTLKWKHNLY